MLAYRRAGDVLVRNETTAAGRAMERKSGSGVRAAAVAAGPADVAMAGLPTGVVDACRGLAASASADATSAGTAPCACNTIMSINNAISCSAAAAPRAGSVPCACSN